MKKLLLISALASSLVLATFLGATTQALAERVIEVQNIQVSKSGANGREAAVMEATRKAAAAVWAQLGHEAATLPVLTSQQLQDIASYIDVTKEAAQPNFYSATLNIGVRVSVLDPASATEAEQTAGEQQMPASAAVDLPDWVLIVPAYEQEGGGLALWTNAGQWQQVWSSLANSGQGQRAVGTSVLVAGGDSEDTTALSATALDASNPQLATALEQLAHKYKAPAVALAVLSAPSGGIVADSMIGIETLYYQVGSFTIQTAQTRMMVNAGLLPSAMQVAAQQGQQQLADLLKGQAMGVGTQLTSGASLTPRAAQPQPINPALGSSSAMHSAVQQSLPPAALRSTPPTSLTVRLPITSAADLGQYRRKIAAITGASFNVSALSRSFVEGVITYQGSEADLLKALAAQGLAVPQPN